jgi:molybdenum cofactor biosynthesis enzyme
LTVVSVACARHAEAVDRSMTIEAISVTEKHGGASGDYVRGDA